MWPVVYCLSFRHGISAVVLELTNIKCDKKLSLGGRENVYNSLTLNHREGNFINYKHRTINNNNYRGGLFIGMSRLIGTADKSADIWRFQNNR
jgi:hypothetical protein